MGSAHVTSPVTSLPYNGRVKLATIWDERYSVNAAYTNSTLKQAHVVHAALDEGLLELRPVAFNAGLTWADIACVHNAAYVNAVRTGSPRILAESQGFDWSPAFAESVALIWNGHVAACRRALDEKVVFHPVSGAHHADRDTGSGYCTFNFLVGAGRRLLDDGSIRRVLVIDLDFHQGNGTHALVADDERFALFDIAGANWIGEFEGERHLYQVVSGPEEYRAQLGRLPAAIDGFEPDLVQYQAGMDCHERDPVGGIDDVDEDFLAERDRFVIKEVARRRIPLVINLAGGYQEDGTSVRLHVQTARIAVEVMSGPLTPAAAPPPTDRPQSSIP